MMIDLDYRKIYKLIDENDIISFDIFDTLIIRATNSPTQIFNIVEKEYNIKNKNNTVVNFKINRIKAEKEIKNKIPNIDDIYIELQKYYSNEICEKLKDEEIRIEKKYCVYNKKIKKIYDYCISKKKEIYVVSDMYLPSDILEEILKKNGYLNITKIIVSCEYDCNKLSSKLFMNLPISKKNKILHIGDSLRADYLGAKIAGINALKIKKYKKNYNNDNIDKLIKLHGADNYYESLGINILGPILLIFSKWLEKQISEIETNKIFFLAREGKIFKEVFDQVNEYKYKTKYICISRRTITMANYNNMKFSNMIDILKYFTIKKDSTLNDVVDYLNLDIKIDKELMSMNAYKLTDNNLVCEAIKNSLCERSKEENIMVKKYFKQENLSGNFVIIDIGWNGTMQKCIEKYLQTNKVEFSMFGLYFSTFKEIKNSKAFIKNNTEIYNSIRDNPLLIENIFQYVDGSTIGYKEIENYIIPLKKKCEFDSYSSDAIYAIDRGIMKFIEKWKEYGYINNIEVSKEIYLEKFRKYIDKPTKNDIKFFSNFKYSDIKDAYIIYPNKSITKIKEGLVSSAWKYAYLKNILKLNLNYKKIIKFLKGEF